MCCFVQVATANIIILCMAANHKIDVLLQDNVEQLMILINHSISN